MLQDKALLLLVVAASIAFAWILGITAALFRASS
jgi:hypothetical protein